MDAASQFIPVVPAVRKIDRLAGEILIISPQLLIEDVIMAIDQTV